jgi:hypothetical protein
MEVVVDVRCRVPWLRIGQARAGEFKFHCRVISVLASRIHVWHAFSSPFCVASERRTELPEWNLARARTHANLWDATAAGPA